MEIPLWVAFVMIGLCIVGIKFMFNQQDKYIEKLKGQRDDYDGSLHV